MPSRCSRKTRPSSSTVPPPGVRRSPPRRRRIWASPPSPISREASPPGGRPAARSRPSSPSTSEGWRLVMSGTVAKAFNLLELLSKYDGPVRMADLARAASMNKSTAYRLLETLSQLGYVTQDEPNGRYLLTTKMWEIGVRAFQRSDLRIAAKPYLEELVAKTGEMAVLSRRDGRDVIVVEKV